MHLHSRSHIGFIILILVLSLPGCVQEKDSGDTHEIPGYSGTTYARGFSIQNYGDFSLISVRDPWQGASGMSFTYVLGSEGKNIPDSLADLPVLIPPLKRVVCMSTTHVAMLHALGETSSIVGISGKDYVSNPVLREKFASGELADVGAEQTLNYEKIISIAADAVIAYGVTAEISGMVERLGSAGIPVILDADYLENEPLGKTEWIRFLAMLFDKSELADSIFHQVEAGYNQYSRLAGEASARPRIMSGLPWKDSWYVPGGESFAAAFIRDAGGDYIFSDMDSREAAPVDLETVYARAGSADVWINTGSANSLEDILHTEARLGRFRPYLEKRVYNNIARMNPAGGNDFWETGVMEPHLILADLLRIFHPELLPEHELRYYRKLE